MNEKKTVLFLMNGLGAESSKSYEVINEKNMPTFTKLMNAYPFKLLFSQGEMVGLNEGQASNFKTGYYNFSTFGHPAKKEDILFNKIEANEFLTNQIVNESIEIALANNSRLHVMFTLGDKVNNNRYNQLKTYLEYALQKGITEVFIHLVLGDSSVRGSKIANKCIADFKNRVIRYLPQCKIASICGRMYIKDGSNSEIATFYRMMVSGVGEVWPNYSETITKKYDNRGMTDDNINGFITIREPLVKSGDSFFLFNYSNNMAKKFLEILLSPKKYFPTSNVPEGVLVNSMFSITDMAMVPCAFKDELPTTYLFDKIPEDKKILIIAQKERIPYISKCLNGFRGEFRSNVSVWPIEDDNKRFESTSQYAAAYINQDAYSLIIIDCELYAASDERTIAHLENNLQNLDKCLNIVYNRCIEKNYRLVATSLYGIKQTFKLTETMELVDLSNKVPYLLIDKEIRRVDISFKPEGTFIDAARLIAISFGTIMPNNLIAIEMPGEEKKINKSKLLIIVVGIIFVLFVAFVFMYNYGII